MKRTDLYDQSFSFKKTLKGFTFLSRSVILTLSIILSRLEAKKMNEIKKQKRGVDYSWVIIGLCFAMVFTGLGFCSSGKSMYLTAITDALSIPRGAFSLNNTFRYVATTVANLFFGALIKRFGSKTLICAGFVCLIGFALLSSFSTTLIGFYVAGVLLGLGIAWTSTTMVSYVINKHCKENKGTITGAVLAANGIGGAVAAQIVSPIIFEDGNPFGYRTAYRLVALILAAVLVLFILFYRNPSQAAADPSPKRRKIRGAGWVGMEYSEVIKKPYFYVALVCIFLIGMVLQGLNGVATPHMYDIGMDVSFVALTVSISGLCLSAAKFIVGFFYDRFGIKAPMNTSLICAFVSMAILATMKNNLAGQVMAIIRVFADAFALPLETVMLSIFAVEFFGNKSFDKLIGIITAVSAAGFAVGAPFGNVCYDIFGDYKPAFLVFACLMAVVAIALQFVLRAANRDRKAILEAEEDKQ